MVIVKRFCKFDVATDWYLQLLKSLQCVSENIIIFNFLPIHLSFTKLNVLPVMRKFGENWSATAMIKYTCVSVCRGKY